MFLVAFMLSSLQFTPASSGVRNPSERDAGAAAGGGSGKGGGVLGERVPSAGVRAPEPLGLGAGVLLGPGFTVLPVGTVVYGF